MHEAGGFHGVNRQVKAALRDWLAETGRELLRTAEAEEGTGRARLQFGLARLLSSRPSMTRRRMYRRCLRAVRLRRAGAPEYAQHGGQSGEPGSAGQVRRGGADVSPRDRGQGRGVRSGASARTLGTVGNLAILLGEQGKYDEAEPMYRRALAGEEEALGPAHPSTLATVGNLAILFAQQGKLDEAEPLFRRELAGEEEALGPAHPDTLGTVVNLAGLLKIRASTTRRSRWTAARLRVRRRRSGRRTRRRSGR